MFYFGSDAIRLPHLLAMYQKKSSYGKDTVLHQRTPTLKLTQVVVPMADPTTPRKNSAEEGIELCQGQGDIHAGALP